MTINNRAAAPPFVTADGSTIREFLNPGLAPLRNMSLAEATLSPGQKTTRHYHPRAEEIYLVLQGSGLMEVAGDVAEVGPGDAIAIPNGLPHQITNNREEPLVFLCCCAPSYLHADTVLLPLE